MPPFNPETHREDYTKVEGELSSAKLEITGEKSVEELSVLIEKRKELEAQLEQMKNDAHEEANRDNEALNSAEENKGRTQKEIDDLKAHIESLDIEIEKIKGPNNPLNDVSNIEKKLKDLGSPATLDTSFEGGIISLNIDQTTLESLSTYEKAIQAYKEADNDSPSWIYDELKNIPYQSPTTSNLDVLVMNHGSTNLEQRDKLVEDMNNIGYRPLELSELIALGILKPEYKKRSEYLTTYKKYSLVGDSRVPFLNWFGDKRYLFVNDVSDDWNEHGRFVFVRK